MTGQNTQVRAIILTAVMVLSVVAFAVPASAAVDSGSRSADSTVTPSGTTTVTVTATLDGDGGAFTLNETFSGSVDSASIQSVQVDGADANTVVEVADSEGAVVTIGDGETSANSDITITYDITATDAAGTDITISGEVTGGGSTVDLGTDTISVEEAQNGGNGNGDGGDGLQGDADDNMQSGVTFWQGQELFFDGSNIVADVGNADAEERTFQIRRVNEDDEVAGLAREFTINSDGEKNIDSSTLDGSYVITYQGDIVEVDSNGVGSNEGSETVARVQSAQWEIAPQTLSVAFDEDDVPVLQEETATLEMDSNRGSYTVNISADGLDEEDLGDILNQGADGNDVVAASLDDEDEDDSVQVETTADGEIEFNFTVFDDVGDYTIDVESSDTTASDSASITVQEKDADMNFDQSVFSDSAGDEVDITIELEDTDTAWLFVGGEDTNYLERLELEDDDDDGEIVVTMNTWLAGVGDGTSGDAYDSEDDNIIDLERYSTDGGDGSTALPDVDIAASLADPIEPGSYDLRVSSSGDIEDDGDLPDEQDVATLDLRDPTVDGISTHLMETGGAAGTELEDIIEDARPGSTVALSDRLIVQVEANGYYGYILDEDEATLQQNGVNLLLEQTNEAANQDPLEIDIQGNGVELVTDADNNTFYVVLDMRDLQTQRGIDIDDGDTFEAEFAVWGDEADVQDDLDRNDFNPYLDDEEEMIVTTEFTAQDAEADFDNVRRIDGEDTLEVLPESGYTVSGTTNIAPGTEFSIRARKDTEPAFLKTQEVTVADDGTWSATFDFSDTAVDAEFDWSIREGGNTLEEIDGVVVTEVGTPTPTPQVVTRTVQAPSPTPREVEVTRTVIQPSPTPVERTVVRTRVVEVTPTTGQPGFGIAVAIVALLAAALLALRRRD